MIYVFIHILSIVDWKGKFMPLGNFSEEAWVATTIYDLAVCHIGL